MLASGMQAVERTLQQKIQLAVSVLSANGGSGAQQRVKDAALPHALKTTRALTVIGYEDGGFAVISNDDGDEPVIGYSDGVFSEGDMPAGFEWWLKAADEALGDNAAYVRTQSYIPEGLPSEVGRMLTSRWGQASPFSDMCPGKYPSGCVATSMAQIMYYHKYPEHGEGSVFDMGTATFVDFENTTYDYGGMIDYYGDGFTAEQGSAVATLMRHCGVSVRMKYSESGSGAYTSDAAGAFRTNFRYNTNVGHRVRDYHTKADWMGIVFNELAAGRPILYGGQSQGGGRDAGHAFVFDGYNAEGFVHVNWGWDGSYDGYYDVALLNPEGYEYSSGQQMVVGIGRPEESIAHRSEMVSDSEYGFSVSFSGATVSVQTIAVYNYNDYTFDGDLLLMLDGMSSSYELFSYSLADKPMAVTPGSGSVPGINISNMRASLPSGLADGTYTLYLAVRDKGFTEISPVLFKEGKTRCYILTKKGSDVTLSKSTDDPVSTGIDVIGGDTGLGDGFTRVYDTEGRLVYKVSEGAFRLSDVPARGMLIIKNGGSVRKVMRR